MSQAETPTGVDHSSDERFKDYYAEKSASAAARAHFTRIRDKSLAVRRKAGASTQKLKVLDIGCNAGTQARVWAELGHDVTGLDVNEPLLLVARDRAAKDGLKIQFDLGTATALPYANNCMDAVLLLELLEHVQDWQSVVREAVRVLKPGGVLYLSTTNALCPKQQEFNLPFYSWYPAPLKRHYERLSVTTRPELANFARYPAVHWFTYSGLSKHLDTLGLNCMDRFDLIETEGKGAATTIGMSLVRNLPPVRWFGHVLTAGTSVLGVKRAQAQA